MTEPNKLRTKVVPIPYKVYIVVDREFGERLAEIERGVPVWIVDTPANKVIAQRLWKENPQENHLTGITTFRGDGSSPPEEVLLAELDTIDLHHGSFSVLEVVGTKLSARIEKEMSAYDFNKFQPNSSGFTATRPVPEITSGPTV